MSIAFKARVNSTQKLVLLALCDAANDQGECYPSVPTLIEKTSLGERSIQGAVAALEESGHLRREFRVGRSTVYWMTPAADAPQQQMPPARRAPTPAADAPPPPHDVHHPPARRAPITVTEPSVEPLPKQLADSRSALNPPIRRAVSSWKQITELPKGWELPEEWGADAEALGWKPNEIIRESEKFRQYWTTGKGAGSRKGERGWRQSWSNWLAKAEKFK